MIIIGNKNTNYQTNLKYYLFFNKMNKNKFRYGSILLYRFYIFGDSNISHSILFIYK